MDLGTKGDVIVLHDMLRLLPKIRTKYWELGRRFSKTELPKEFKDNFYSLGNDIDKFLKLSKSLGQDSVNKT